MFSTHIKKAHSMFTKYPCNGGESPFSGFNAMSAELKTSSAYASNQWNEVIYLYCLLGQ